MEKRTSVRFRYEGDAWAIVDAWAEQTPYKRVRSNASEHTYHHIISRGEQ